MAGRDENGSGINKVLRKIFEMILANTSSEITQASKMIRSFRNPASVNRVYFVLCTCEYVQLKCECCR